MPQPRLTSIQLKLGKIILAKMEVLTSVWFLLLISCTTDWFGFQQCVAVPVPTLNYYPGSPQNNWSFKYRRNPTAYYEKFTFPNKVEPLGIVGVGARKAENSGKIFFPDEVSDTDKPDKSYHFSDGDVRPVWKIRHRPTSSGGGSGLKKKSFNKAVYMTPSVDGSPQFDKMQLSNENKNIGISDSDRSEIAKQAGPDTENLRPEQRVAAAVEEFYDWLRKKESTKAKLANSENRGHDLNSPSSSENCQPAEKQDETISNTTEGHISDQSLVAGLKDQKCPDGQVRLENGECKVTVSV